MADGGKNIRDNEWRHTGGAREGALILCLHLPVPAGQRTPRYDRGVRPITPATGAPYFMIRSCTALGCFAER